MIKRKIDSDKIFGFFNGLILTIITILVIYPIYFILVASISDPKFVNLGQTMFFPRGITFLGYQKILEQSQLLIGFKNSIINTVVGTLINMIVCIPTAFALSRPNLPGKKALNTIFLFTMYFSGGLIPEYLLLRDLDMLNSIWAVVLPGALSVYNMIICRSFFQSNVSEELFESVKIDGGTEFTFFFKIVLPLSKAILAVMVLYHALAHWNNYLSVFYYIRDHEKYTLQVVLKNMTAAIKSSSMVSGIDSKTLSELQRAEQMTRYSVVIVASIPVFILYPFVQKYFVKGVMVGSVKG